MTTKCLSGYIFYDIFHVITTIRIYRAVFVRGKLFFFMKLICLVGGKSLTLHFIAAILNRYPNNIWS